jgi:hypothetical protein
VLDSLVSVSEELVPIRQVREPVVSPARIIAAWLDGQGRVLYVGSPKIAFVVSTLESAVFKESVNLAAGHFERFMYVNKDPALAPLLGEATLALWGTSK